jgi:hypothetical protein
MVIAHLLLKHPTTGKEVWVAVHTKKMPGRPVVASCESPPGESAGCPSSGDALLRHG